MVIFSVSGGFGRRSWTLGDISFPSMHHLHGWYMDVFALCARGEHGTLETAACHLRGLGQGRRYPSEVLPVGRSPAQTCCPAIWTRGFSQRLGVQTWQEIAGEYDRHVPASSPSYSPEGA